MSRFILSFVIALSLLLPLAAHADALCMSVDGSVTAENIDAKVVPVAIEQADENTNKKAQNLESCCCSAHLAIQIHTPDLGEPEAGYVQLMFTKSPAPVYRDTLLEPPLSV